MRRIVALAALLALFAAACGSSGPLVVDAELEEQADYSYTILAGSGEAIDRGEPLDILPAELVGHVGEVFELINLDDRGHLVGPFFVGAGETMRQRFNSPGSFVGACSVHPSGEFVLTVVE
jgi:hypothetical protein